VNKNTSVPVVLIPLQAIDFVRSKSTIEDDCRKRPKQQTGIVEVSSLLFGADNPLTAYLAVQQRNLWRLAHQLAPFVREAQGTPQRGEIPIDCRNCNFRLIFE
jgi:hypothetical protein